MNPNKGANRVFLLPLAVLLSGCVAGLVMDTGRALPAGEDRVIAAVGAGVQTEQIVTLTSPRQPERQPVEPGVSAMPYEIATYDFPETAFQLEWMVRWSRGLGAGFQLDVQASLPVPNAISVGLGLKWELVLPDASPVALAFSARAIGMASAFEILGVGGSTQAVTSDPGVIFSFHFRRDHAVYLSPRVRWDLVRRSSWVEDDTASTSAGIRSYAGALGWTFATSPDGALFFEVNVIHSPQPSSPDGWRVIGGIGGTMGP